MMRFLIFIFLTLIVVACPSARRATAAIITLYDATLGGNPDSQGWLTRSGDAGAVETVSPNGTSLDTTAAANIQSGYSNLFSLLGGSFPALDRQSGYRLRFTVQLGSESHTSGHRAGFSLIALTDDQKGIELGFWQDEIWAQEGGAGNLFTKAESAAFDTTQTTTYDLTIVGDNYTLASGGGPILANQVRDYTAFVGFPDVYEIASFLFLGDNTTSAQAQVTISLVTLTTPAPPQPVGDTNGDGRVDIDDLNNVRNNFGASAPPDPPGDTNADGTVNIDDLNNVRNNFGAMAAAASNVPEPGGWTIGVLAWLGTLTIGARRGRSIHGALNSVTIRSDHH